MADLSTLSDDDLAALEGKIKQKQFSQSQESAGPMQKAINYGEAFSSGAIQGLGNIGANIGSLEAQAVDKIFGTQFAKDTPKFELPQSKQQLMKAYPNTSAVGQFAGEALPMMAIPGGAMGEMESLAPAIEKLPQAMQGIAKFGGKAAKAAGTGAAISPIYEPDEPFSESMPEGALLAQLGPIAEGAVGLGKGGLQYLQKMGGMATKVGAEKVMQAAESLGLKVPAGEVIKSKGLKSLQSLLGSVPGSGMPEAYDNLAVGLQGKIDNLLTKLNPDNVHSGEAVQEHLFDKYSEVKDTANQLYGDLRDAISSSAPGEIHQNKSLSSEARNISEELSRRSKQPAGYTKVPKDVKKVVDQIESGSYTLSDAIETDENINNLIGDNIADVKKGGREGQDAKRAINYLRKIKEANNKDIGETIRKVDVPEITELWDSAKDHYKKEMVPFVEKGSKLQEIIQEKNPDKVQGKFLSTSGTQPKSFILKQVTNELPQDVKDKIAHQYLMGAKEEPEKMLQKFDKLQPKQKESLFSPEDLETLENMSTLKKHFGSDFNQMFSPKTGIIAKSAVPLAIGAYGYKEGGVPGAIGAVGAAGLGGKGLKSALMSDTMKKQFLKSASKQAKPTDLGIAGLMGIPFMGNSGSK
jgi:hypothetical protein